MNPLLLGISQDTSLNESKRLIIVNILTIVSVVINFTYFIILFSIGNIFYSFLNLACGIIFGFVGFYFMNKKKYQVVKVFNLTAIPSVLVLFGFIYGDVGLNVCIISFSISTFFILNDKKTILFINIWLFLIFLFISIGTKTNLFIPINENTARMGKIFYWSNISFGFICNFIILAIFKSENLRYEVNLEEKNYQILQQNKELQQINLDKNNFITIIAHDLKNPFGSMHGLLSLLTKNIRKYDIDKVESFITTIHKASQNTNNLLDDLLMWGKLKTNDLIFVPQSEKLITVCKEIYESLKLTATEKNITLKLFCVEEIVVFADLNMLKTVLRNLISNAIKYTNSGGTIIMSAEKIQSNVKISVSDNGIGISQDKLIKLFNPSQMSTTPGTINEKGTGLGLLLCKECVEKNNGSIHVESELGKGSNFYFYIPCSNE